MSIKLWMQLWEVKYILNSARFWLGKGQIRGTGSQKGPKNQTEVGKINLVFISPPKNWDQPEPDH